MTDVKKSNELANKELQTLLNIKHIRQHLINVGLNTRQGRRSKSPNNYSIDRRRRSTTISRTRQRSRSQSPTRLSSSNQSTRAKSVLVRRTVSPKVILDYLLLRLTSISHRCIVTMIYYGSHTNIPYERSFFQPEGDEIIIMQQHCGGENVIVYKGSLKPNKTFQFESQRHAEYPFALTFYVNGLIDNRLSICCEYRYKHNVRIGGKRGLFGIINVLKSKASNSPDFHILGEKIHSSMSAHHKNDHPISKNNRNLKAIQFLANSFYIFILS
ncbi:unnamed protein product [Rotaria sp. Silwood2]|nr:unnamed protein product [Rotaria sp. Silwood2]CAF4221143.1 unnamed protein product [Rotaria sp. Silwood2]